MGKNTAEGLQKVSQPKGSDERKMKDGGLTLIAGGHTSQYSLRQKAKVRARPSIAVANGPVGM